jgi:hypothetical protein
MGRSDTPLRLWDGDRASADAGVRAGLASVARVQSLPPPGAPLPPPQPSALVTAPAPRTSGIPVGSWLLLGAAIAAVIGALLPWARIELSLGPQALTTSVAGTEGDGVITLVLGLALGALAVLVLNRARLTLGGVLAIVVASALLAIALIDIVDVNRTAGDINNPLVTVGVGAGLWVTLVAGLAGVLGGVLLLLQRPRPVA